MDITTLHLGFIWIFAILGFAINYIMARRLKDAKKTLAQQKLLNQLIIDNITTGVILLSAEQKILLRNNKACQIFPQPQLPTKLATMLANWQQEHKLKSSLLTLQDHKLQVSFKQLPPNNLLILLEDITSQNQQAHQMKLAAVGRLTASIAHEIRNPLGAISHASQLLAESTALNQYDQRLLDIIQDNSKRTNNIIGNVLLLSKLGIPQQKHIVLETYLHKFANQLIVTDISNLDINIEVTPPDLALHVDPYQLQQILTNLSENGIRYSLKNIKQPYLLLRCTTCDNGATVIIDIIDKGKPINDELAECLFEPFFTTEHTGTGLGLFVAKELCQANNAELEYIATYTAGTNFRITFTHQGSKHE